MAARVWVLAENDGEAVEIVRLLRERSERVLASRQAWGATWRDLEPEIRDELRTLRESDSDLEIIGIELAGGNGWGARNIDHHRYPDEDRSHPLSAIEQIAYELGVSLSRSQQLVGANDRGYIPAMQALGATEEEIAEVRAQDRRAQGLIEADEQRARDDLARAEWRGRRVLVRCTERVTSAHSDLLWGKAGEVLLVSDKEWSYTGPRSRDFAAAGFPEAEQWSGGAQESGYFGVASPGEATQRKMLEMFWEDRMEHYYLRIEGVNLKWFVYDTQDLSTTRGGSQLLNNAMGGLSQEFPVLKPLSTGASAGIFEFTSKDPDQVTRDIRTYLAGNAGLKHGTFVVNWCKAGMDEEEFAADRESLLAKNRHEQMIRPALAIPGTRAALACEMDGVRPATREVQKGPEVFRASESVHARRRYGQRQKKTLIGERTSHQGISVCEDLQTLTSSPPPKYGKLSRKMAILFLDGNGFGEIQNKLCRTKKAQESFDQTLRDKSAAILEALVNMAEEDRAAWFTREEDGNDLRLEVLVLAGDEIRLVVPAWRGWAALDKIFELAQGWEYTGPQGKERLTYKAGLVFCHHNAPIHRMLQLADDLATEAKANAGALAGGNIFAYQAMESFDLVGRDFGEARRDARLPGTGPESYVLPGERMRELAELTQKIRKVFPRNKLHKIVNLFFAGQKVEANETISKEIKDAPEFTRQAIREMQQWLGGAGWLHVLDLADYTV